MQSSLHIKALKLAWTSSVLKSFKHDLQRNISWTEEYFAGHWPLASA